MFIVGRFLDPQPDDAKCERYVDAHCEAERQAKRDEREAIAVWDNDSNLICVFLRGYRLVIE